MTSMRRSSTLLPAAVLAGGALLLSGVFSGPETQGFLTAPAVSTRPGRVAMRSLKDDFESWRSTLTPEEQKLLQKQAQSEFDKKFRNSADFEKDLPEEKVKSFAKILSKFFESEAEDYKKEKASSIPVDYDGLLKKAQGKTFDFSLRNEVVEVDRDAERRYRFATMMDWEDEENGVKSPSGAIQERVLEIQNNDTSSHEGNKQILELVKKAMEEAKKKGRKIEAKDQQFVETGVPALGEKFHIRIPDAVFRRVGNVLYRFRQELEERQQNMTETELKAWKTAEEAKVQQESIEIVRAWRERSQAIEEKAMAMKAAYRSQREMPGKTKADVLKEIWAALPKMVGKPVPPLDEESLAELAQEPAVIPGEFRHSWGIADKLYKSEAIDAFGIKYLLGVYETKEEAVKAFDEWNAEYEKARKEMKDEMTEWGKQEQAKLDADTTGADRIRAVLEESRR